MAKQDILSTLEESFHTYILTDSRSNQKLKVLHGAISRDLKERLGSEFDVTSLGTQYNKEKLIPGHFFDKRVDIVISKDGNILGGIAVKYVMRNYKQNSINYFENMLGETVNIRANGNPYFQIVILHKHIPYFEKEGDIKTIEEINEENINKYMILSNEDENTTYVPVRTLLMIIDHKNNRELKTKDEYKRYYTNRKNIKFKIVDDNYQFNDLVIYNQYGAFIDKVAHYFQAL